jgi:hypothetical protein
MLSAECLTLRGAHVQRPLSEPAGARPLVPIAAGGLSGRPRCRIFPVGRLWVLQPETPSGWLLGDGAGEPPPRITFPTLAAAVNHAVLHGYDYRIITPTSVACLTERGRRMARDESRPPLYGRSTSRSRTEH